MITIAKLRQAGWYEGRALANYLIESGWPFPDLVKRWEETSEERRAILREGAKIEKRVAGEYVSFGGTRTRPIPFKVEFTGTLVGGWIHLDGGGKKRADGGYITFKEVAE